MRESAGQSVSFSGHETFVFRYTWLKKAVDAVEENPRIFTENDAIVTLGVGKNMVRSMRHWALATGVIQEEAKSRGSLLRVTDFGRFLFGSSGVGGADPFLEDPNTLWLLHWALLSSENKGTAWRWAFNKFPANEFTREGFLQIVEDEMRRINLPVPSESTLTRDIEVFVKTYLSGRGSRVASEDSLDCPLTELNLLDEMSGASLLRIQRGPKNTLSDRVFAYCLWEFWKKTGSGTVSLGFSEIAYGENSPGVIFKLDENSLVERLDRLNQVTRGALGYSEGAGLKQVYQQQTFDSVAWLSEHYEQTNPILVGV